MTDSEELELEPLTEDLRDAYLHWELGPLFGEDFKG